jgi:O-succinylbenzoate synthase
MSLKQIGIKIDRIVLREIRMPLVSFFETSFGRTYDRKIVLVEVHADGAIGWGEVTAGENPFYNEETTETSWHIIKEFVAPRVLNQELSSAGEIRERTRHIRGHNMACGGVETAAWELEARRAGLPLWKYIGGVHQEIACGVSIGIKNTIPDLLEAVSKEVAAGYQRIKVKIKPGWDLNVLGAIRERFPQIKLMADANSAYTLADVDHLKKFDQFYLMMIEQPLPYYDIIDHAKLQAKIETPVCLDECIKNAHICEQALAIGAGRIVNLKLGRVGGFAESKRVHDICQAHKVPVWCGGMLESGVGRAHNIAMSTLANFILPGDVSASKRYWKQDVIVPPVEVSAQGTITVSQKPGLGYDIDQDFIDSITVRREELV